MVSHRVEGSRRCVSLRRRPPVIGHPGRGVGRQLPGLLTKWWSRPEAVLRLMTPEAAVQAVVPGTSGGVALAVEEAVAADPVDADLLRAQALAAPAPAQRLAHLLEQARLERELFRSSIRATIAMAATALMSSTSGLAASSGAESPGVAQKVENAVRHGAAATAHGVERGAEATKRGLQRAANATAHGVSVAASGVARCAWRQSSRSWR